MTSNPGTSTYPGTADAFARIGTATYENDTGYEHDLVHNQAQDAIENIESVVGTTSGTGVLTNFVAGDLAARVASETLTTPNIQNATIGTPAITGGTVDQSVLSNNTIGTPAISGGTASTTVLANNTIGTPAISSGTALAMTLGTPTIGDFTNATHDHSNAAGGGDSVSHTDLDDIGSNTHSQIDTHIGATGSAVHGLGDISTQDPSAVSITGGTIDNVIMGTPDITGGSVDAAALGTPTITGGNWNAGTMGTPDITDGTANGFTLGTPTVTEGTWNAATIGTPAITDGTANGFTLGTPAITEGTATSMVMGSPTITGTVGGTTNFATYPEVGGTAQNSDTAMWNASQLLGNPISTMGTGEDGLYAKYDNANGSVVWDTPSGAGDMGTVTYDPGTVAEQLVGITATQTLTNKTISDGCALDGSADANFTNHSMARQAIINGNFDVWQRGTSFSTGGEFTADRWRMELNGSSCTTTRQAFTPGQTDVPNEPAYYIRNVVTSSAGASNYVLLSYKVESVRSFAGQTATLSFWAKADASKNIGLSYVQNYGSGGSPSSAVWNQEPQLVALTTSWVKQTITFTIPSLSGKTLGTTNDGYFMFRFFFDSGSTYDEGSASLGQQSGTFEIAQVQFCAGSVALPFQPKSYADELRACQRYYYRVQATAGSQRLGSGFNSTTTVAYILNNFPVQMRTPPTALEQTGTATDYTVAHAATSATCSSVPTFASANKDIVQTNLTVASGLTAGQGCMARTANANAYFAWSAEL